MVEQEQQHRAPAAAPASRFQRKREGEKTRARGRNEQTVHGRRLLCGAMCLSSMHARSDDRTGNGRMDGGWMIMESLSLALVHRGRKILTVALFSFLPIMGKPWL